MNETNPLGAIGELVKSTREERSLTQGELAKRLGTTQSAVARIETGEQNVSAAMLGKIGKILGKNLVTLSDGALNIEIEGGHALSGSVTTKTSKNAAMGLLSAALLNRGTTTLENVPKIEEVFRMIEVLESTGVSAKWSGANLVIKTPKKIAIEKIDRAAAEKTRSVILLLGSLIHLSKSFILPHPGGCRLGRRTVTPHFYALENFGVKIKTTHDDYAVSVGKPKSSEVVLYESGDTVTENAVLAAALMPKKTVIKYASANYQIQEICYFLEKLGVKIGGIGTTTLEIEGVAEINRNISYGLSEDPIESMFFIAAAAVTRSQIKIERCPIDFLELELLRLKKMGLKFRLSARYKARNGRTDLVDITTFPSNLRAPTEKIEARPYPGLNIDNLPFFAIIATQAKGQTLIHDWVYENRAIYYKELDKLGAETILADPHRLFVTGPTELKAAEIMTPPALRPAAIILIGMLAAKRGKSILRNIYSINRGYEDIIKRLNSLGAKIRILREI